MLPKDIFEIKDNFLKDVFIKSELIYGSRIENPFISIMIPTYERFDFLLKSVESALNQETSIPFEIVVVDNSDNVNIKFIEWLKENNYSQVCYYKNNENLGMFGNWNRCITLANGEWILILNDDDEITIDYVEKMGGIVNKKKDISLLCCSSCVINEIGESRLPPEEKRKLQKMQNNYMKRKLINGDLLLNYSIREFYISWYSLMGGTLINKNSAIKVGGFNADAFPCADLVFIMQLIFLDGGVFVNYRKLFKYRIAVNESMNVSTSIMFAEYNSDFCQYMNEKYRIFPKAIAQWHRSNKVLAREEASMSLVALENRTILSQEFESLNEKLKIAKQGKLSKYLYRMICKLNFNFILLFKTKYYKN